MPWQAVSLPTPVIPTARHVLAATTMLVCERIFTCVFTWDWRTSKLCVLNRYFPIRKGKRSWVGGLSGQSFMWLTSFTDILLYIYVVRIENTLVMTHGIASCSFLLSFFLHSPREEKTLVFFFLLKMHLFFLFSYSVSRKHTRWAFSQERAA